LQIRRNAGLGRGRESYNVELSGIYFKNLSFFLTASSPIFNLTSNDQNRYDIITPYEQTRYWLKVSGSGFTRKLEFGLQARSSRPGLELIGGTLRASPIGSSYLLADGYYDRQTKARTYYARLGYYLYNGIDMYYEYDSYRSDLVEATRQAIGIDIALRPRFSLGLKYIFGESNGYQYQSRLWM
jgi:hypothetical protein